MHTDARTPLLAPTASVDPEQGLGGDVGMQAEDALPPLQVTAALQGMSNALADWRGCSMP